MQLKKWLAVLVTAAMVTAMTACGGSDSGSTGTSEGAASGDSVAGDSESAGGGTAANRIVIARPADSNNLDPVTSVGNTNIWIYNLMLEGLVKTSDDGATIEPDLAESWDISDDGLTYTFHLKEGLLFSDGTPVTAEDWAWSFNRAKDTEDSRWLFATQGMETIEAPDDTTLVITMSAPSAALMANLCMFTLTAQSKAHYDAVGEEGYADGVIGTGPYMLNEWKKGEEISLVRNPHYREAGVPATDEIVFKVVADDAARTMQLQAGEVDAITFVPFSTLKELESAANVNPLALPGTETRFMALNIENEHLAKLEVRQALNMATDAQQIVDMVLYGYGTKGRSFMNTTSPYLDTSIPEPEYSVEAAQELMNQAGYEGSGFTIDMLIHAGNAFEEQIATILKEQWAKIGVDVNIMAEESGNYTDKLYGTDFDTVIDYWTDDIADPSQYMAFVCDFDLCSGFDTNYQNPRLTELNEMAGIETDDAKRREYYNEIQQIIYDEQIFIPLCYVPYAVAISSDVEGFVQTPLGNYRFDHMVKNG